MTCDVSLLTAIDNHAPSPITHTVSGQPLSISKVDPLDLHLSFLGASRLLRFFAPQLCIFDIYQLFKFLRTDNFFFL